MGRNLWLPDSKVESQAPAVAEVIEGLAGRARILWELATGTVPDNETRVTPLNPQGLVGCDCSGPPWGSAHRHPIAWWGGIKPDSATFSSNPRAIAGTTIASSTLQAPSYHWEWNIWVRPFEYLPAPAIAPLSRAYVLLSGYTSSATSVTLTVTACANGQHIDDGHETTQATTATTADTAYTIGTDCYFDLRPGRNRIRLHIINSSTTVYFTPTKIMIYHKAKRSQ